MHALIIEDEPLIAMSIEDALRDCGCLSVDMACTVEAALAAAQARCPDIITADVQLSPGSGIDAIQAICANKTIPVIFITGTPAEIHQRLPGQIILQKPFITADLVSTVQRLIAKAA